MSAATSSHDFATSEGLRAILSQIAAAPDGWNTHPLVPGMLAHVTEKYAPLCAANNRPAADAATAAFHAMRQPGILAADDLWAVVTKAITLEVRAEARAERGLMSVDQARRPATCGNVEVTRAGERDWLLDTGHVASPQIDLGPTWRTWQATAARFLTVCGWPASLARLTLDLVMTQATSGSRWPQVREQVRADQALPARLGMNPGTWRDVVRLLLGVDPHTSQAGLGLIRAVVAGAHLSDLLADEALADRAAACASKLAG